MPAENRQSVSRGGRPPSREPSADHVAARPAGRGLHPWAWWSWAVGVAVAVSLTTNPWQLLLIDAAVVAVVLARQPAQPWAHSLHVYLALAGVVLGMRLFFAVVFGSGGSGEVLFRLPQVQLPSWAAGVRIGGPVIAEALLASLFDALRLASMLLCVGAANSLAHPRRALRSVPAALYEVSVAIVVALTVAPQMVESLHRIRRAQRLRGEPPRGVSGLVRVIIPVLEDAVSRSLALAASMDARGFGRGASSGDNQGRGIRAAAGRVVGSQGSNGRVRRSRDGGSRLTDGLLLAGLVLLPIGVFLLLAPAGGPWLCAGVLGVGALCVSAAVRRAGRGRRITRYRPDPWRGGEWLATGCGVVVAGFMVWLTTVFAAWQPNPYQSLAVPFDGLMVVVACLTVLPAVGTPAPVRELVGVLDDLEVPAFGQPADVQRARLRGGVVA